MPRALYLRTGDPRAPCSPCVPKGLWTVNPPAPATPAALHPPDQKSPGQRDRYRKYSARVRSVSNPPPCPCHTHHHQSRPPSPMQCEYYASATGGAERSCLHRPARCQTGIYRNLTPPPNHTRPVVHLCSCRRSAFRTPSPSPAPSAPAILHQSQAAKSLVRSPAPTPTPPNITRHGTSDGPLQHELEEAEKAKEKKTAEASSSTSQALGRDLKITLAFHQPPHPRQQHHHSYRKLRTTNNHTRFASWA